MLNKVPYRKEPVVSIPGFQEPERGNQCGTQLEEISKQVGRKFQRFIHPGDPRNREYSEFSLTAVRDSVISLLDGLQGDIILTAHSLPAISVVEALEQIEKEIRDKVTKLVLIHPVEKPAETIARMDWVRYRGKHPLREVDYYLSGDPELVFEKLIGRWKGNGERFQADLIRYHRDPFDLNQRLDDLHKQYTLIRSRDDLITNSWKGRDPSDITVRKVLESHVPDLSNQDFIW